MTENCYDRRGRLVKTNRSDGSYMIYEYTGGGALLKLFSAAGVFLYSYQYEFNKDGQCRRITRSDNPQYEELTHYNSDKSVACKISSLQGLTRVMAYTANNSVHETYNW